MTTVNEITSKINSLTAQVWAIEYKIATENSTILIEEVLNFLDGVGNGFTTGDYYAPDRYYSKINGVKNIRGNLTGIIAKIYSPSGKLLPSSIEVNGNTIPINIEYSSKYEVAVDY